MCQMGTQLRLLRKGDTPPIFGPCIVAKRLDGSRSATRYYRLQVEVGLGPRDIVLDGYLAPPKKRGHSPQFSAHVCCGQTVGCIRITIGTDVGLGSGDILLDGDPDPLKAAQPPLFDHVHCGQTAGWIKMPLGTEIGLGPGHIVLDGDPAL